MFDTEDTKSYLAQGSLAILTLPQEVLAEFYIDWRIKGRVKNVYIFFKKRLFTYT